MLTLATKRECAALKHSASVSPPMKWSTDNLSCRLSRVPGTQHAPFGTNVLCPPVLGKVRQSPMSPSRRAPEECQAASRISIHIVLSLSPSQLLLVWEVTIYLPDLGSGDPELPSVPHFLAYCRPLPELNAPFYIWGNQGRESINNLPQFSVA